jgi:hypothetical protein
MLSLVMTLHIHVRIVKNFHETCVAEEIHQMIIVSCEVLNPSPPIAVFG